MKMLDEMNTVAEVQEAFNRAVRNLSPDQIKKLKANPRTNADDCALTAHAKAVWRKLASFSGVVYGTSDAPAHHPV